MDGHAARGRSALNRNTNSVGRTTGDCRPHGAAEKNSAQRRASRLRDPAARSSRPSVRGARELHGSAKVNLLLSPLAVHDSVDNRVGMPPDSRLACLFIAMLIEQAAPHDKKLCRTSPTLCLAAADRRQDRWARPGASHGRSARRAGRQRPAQNPGSSRSASPLPSQHSRTASDRLAVRARECVPEIGEGIDPARSRATRGPGARWGAACRHSKSRHH